MDPARSAVQALYRELAARETAHAPALARWQSAFERLHGPMERKRSVDRRSVTRAYGLDDEISLPHLLFAVETFLALYLVGSVQTLMASVATRDRTPALRDLSAGTDSSDLPLTRLADPYLSHLPSIRDEAVIDAIATGVEEQLTRDAQSSDVFDDAFRRHYHALIPKQVRHSIGAHFTPPWLSDYVLTLAEVTPDAATGLSLLDPTCGSGQFLLSSARVVGRAVQLGYVTRSGARNTLLRQVAGLELNPLAALAANVNLLRVAAAIGDGLPKRELLPLPVRVSDALLDTGTAEMPMEGFDTIVGNPPWINWEHLPPHYRAQIEHLWPQLGLFSLKGRERVFSKEDVSGLFLYVAADRYLKRDGRLVFVMPQSVFKSPLNARGFRRFCIGDDREPLRVLQVDDLSGMRVFAEAANRTAVVTIEKGSRTTYPVPYWQWRKSGRVDDRMQWADVASAVVRAPHVAFPTVGAEPTSHWTSVDRRAISLFEKLTGKCPYKARTGIFTGGANGAYYLELLDAGTDVALVRNVTERTRRVVPDVVRALETTYLFPLVRGHFEVVR
jgi:N-6 DNA Methylase